MKEIIQEVDINLDDHLHLEIAVDVDGESVYEERGHSLLTNFLGALYSFFSGEKFPQEFQRCNITTGSTDTWQTNGSTIPLIVARVEYPLASGLYRTVISPDESTWADGNFIQIGGILPGAAGSGITGVWMLQETVLNSGFWWIKDVDTEVHQDVTDVASIDTATYTPIARIVNRRQFPSRSDSSTFGSPSITLGFDSTANTIDQWALNSEIFPYDNTSYPSVVQKTGSVTVSTPVVGSGQSIIEIEQSFVNGHASVGISVSEVGLHMKLEGETSSVRYFGLVARDVITPVAVAAGQTITIKYRVIVQVDNGTGDGGILAGFNEMLYRHIAQASREVKDIFNANRTDGASDGTFMTAGAGGANQWSASLGELENQYLGPQLGHSTKVVANTDFRLQYASGNTVYDGTLALEGQDSRYPHGLGSYEVQCFGPLVHGWEVNVAGGYAQFQVDNVFHNLGDQDLIVNEIGFYVARRSSESSIGYGTAICRNRLTTPFTLAKGAGPYPDQTGEMCKITYIFRVNV